MEPHPDSRCAICSEPIESSEPFQEVPGLAHLECLQGGRSQTRFEQLHGELSALEAESEALATMARGLANRAERIHRAFVKFAPAWLFEESDVEAEVKA